MTGGNQRKTFLNDLKKQSFFFKLTRDFSSSDILTQAVSKIILFFRKILFYSYFKKIKELISPSAFTEESNHYEPSESISPAFHFNKLSRRKKKSFKKVLLSKVNDLSIFLENADLLSSSVKTWFDIFLNKFKLKRK